MMRLFHLCRNTSKIVPYRFDNLKNNKTDFYSLSDFGETIDQKYIVASLLLIVMYFSEFSQYKFNCSFQLEASLKQKIKGSYFEIRKRFRDNDPEQKGNISR